MQEEMGKQEEQAPSTGAEGGVSAQKRHLLKPQISTQLAMRWHRAGEFLLAIRGERVLDVLFIFPHSLI